MKKLWQRICCLLVAVLLCCSLLPFAGAAKSVVLTAVNDSFLTLSDSTMPTRQNGEYYVPYSVFSGSLGVRATYTNQVLTLSYGGNALTFNTAAGTVYDQNMKSYSSPAYSINGTVYVPVRLVCGRFGFSYSTLNSGDTLILRICSGSASLSDSEFLSSSSATIQSMLNAYNGVTAPTAPGTSPAPNQPTAPVQHKPSSVSFVLTGPASEDTISILEALADTARKATFFLPADLSGYDNDLLRRIAAAGHEFGLLADADTPPTTTELAAANKKLFDATGLTTRLLFIEGGADALTAAQRDALTAAGFRLWDATHSVSADDSVSRTVSSLTTTFSSIDSAVVLALPHAQNSGQIIREISSLMRTNAIPERPISLLTTPINRANDIR